MNAPNQNQNRKRTRRTTSLLGRPLPKSSVESTDAGAQTARVSGPYLDTNT